MEKREAGFTILEILLVIALFSVLISLSNIGIRSWLAKSRLDSDVKELYFTFLKARQLAITMQEDYGLRFNEIAREYILFSDYDGDIETYKLRDGVLFSDISFGGDDEMTFKPLGTAEGGHVTLTNETDREYKVVVTGTTGRVRIEEIED